jgi:MoaA/NifB/PqqE/SkfB family radical SAM enzyme
MKNKIKLETVQFYISHTCNLACDNCLSYNNFAIKGHDKFEDYSDDAKQWSQLLQPDDMSIIGGEPLSNPDVHNWVIGIRNLFPNCKDFKVCTNGVFINKHKNNIPHWHNLGVVLEVHSHSTEHFNQAQQDIENILKTDYKKQNTPPVGYPDYYNDDFDIFYVIDNKVFAALAAPYEFKTMGVNTYKNNQWEMFDNNPIAAHMICSIKDAHYIYQGKLYKCGLIVGAQEFVKTYTVKESNKDLINAYVPIQHSAVDVYEQIEKLNKSIPQCALCPTKSAWTLNKKIYDKPKLGLTNRI